MMIFLSFFLNQFNSNLGKTPTTQAVFIGRVRSIDRVLSRPLEIDRNRACC